jgi:hypothetical protein
MISLFTKHRDASLNLVTLPTYAFSHEEADELAAKREAQLRWMREKGMTYLGDPLQRAELRAMRKPPTPRMRLVSVRRDYEGAEANAREA